jgi:hypothetical protein
VDRVVRRFTGPITMTPIAAAVTIAAAAVSAGSVAVATSVSVAATTPTVAVAATTPTRLGYVPPAAVAESGRPVTVGGSFGRVVDR